jgi:hypothetical protein
MDLLKAIFYTSSARHFWIADLGTDRSLNTSLKSCEFGIQLLQVLNNLNEEKVFCASELSLDSAPRSLNCPSRDTVIENGVMTIVTAADAAGGDDADASKIDYQILDVREDGKWYLASIKEQPVETNRSNLQFTLFRIDKSDESKPAPDKEPTPEAN